MFACDLERELDFHYRSLRVAHLEYHLLTFARRPRASRPKRPQLESAQPLRAPHVAEFHTNINQRLMRLRRGDRSSKYSFSALHLQGERNCLSVTDALGIDSDVPKTSASRLRSYRRGRLVMRAAASRFTEIYQSRPPSECLHLYLQRACSGLPLFQDR